MASKIVPLPGRHGAAKHRPRQRAQPARDQALRPDSDSASVGEPASTITDRSRGFGAGTGSHSPSGGAARGLSRPCVRVAPPIRAFPRRRGASRRSRDTARRDGRGETTRLGLSFSTRSPGPGLASRPRPARVRHRCLGRQSTTAMMTALPHVSGSAHVPHHRRRYQLRQPPTKDHRGMSAHDAGARPWRRKSDPPVLVPPRTSAGSVKGAGDSPFRGEALEAATGDTGLVGAREDEEEPVAGASSVVPEGDCLGGVSGDGNGDPADHRSASAGSGVQGPGDHGLPAGTAAESACRTERGHGAGDSRGALPSFHPRRPRRECGRGTR